MALQLGFNGALKLVPDSRDVGCSDAALREVLALTGKRYDGFVKAIDTGETDKAVYWRIVFAILSVHSPIDATFEAYRSLRAFKARYGRVPSQRKLASLLLRARGTDGVVQYVNNKAEYLIAFDAAFSASATMFTRNGESDAEWRARIQRNTRGLGLAKASFAVAISAPATSDVCCVDTHIHALFTGHVAKSSIRPRVYLAIESRIRELAREFGISTFAAQWALWDARRGIVNDHSALAAI